MNQVGMRACTRVKRIVYTFTKLHDSVNEYGGKTKFGPKMENKLKQSIGHRGIFRN